MNQKGPQGWSALHLAAYSGNRELVDALSDTPQRAKLNTVIQNDNGSTPMYIAAQHGHVDAMKAWTDKMETITTRDSRGWGPLHAAANSGHYVRMFFVILLKVGVSLCCHIFYLLKYMEYNMLYGSNIANMCSYIYT